MPCGVPPSGCGRSTARAEALRRHGTIPRWTFDTAAVPSQEARQRGRERTFRDPAHGDAGHRLVSASTTNWSRTRSTASCRAAKEACAGPQGGGHVLLLHVRVRRRSGIRAQRHGEAAPVPAPGLRDGHGQLPQPRTRPRGGLRPRADHLRGPAREALVSRQRHGVLPLRRDECRRTRTGPSWPVTAKNWA